MNLLKLLPILVGKDPNEPLLGRAGLTAMFGVALAFGVKLTSDQVDALVTAALIILPAATALVTAVLARGKVKPMAKIEAEQRGEAAA